MARSDYMSDEKAINEGKLTDGLFKLLTPDTKQRLHTLKKEELKFQVDLLCKFACVFAKYLIFMEILIQRFSLMPFGYIFISSSAKDKTHMLQKERNEWNPVHQSTEEMEHFTQKDLDLLMGRFKGITALR